MYTTDVFTRVYDAREKVCVDFFFLLSRCFLTFFSLLRLSPRARMAIDTPFVYQKSNKKRLPRDGADICEIKCKALACNIQKCIASLPNFKSRVSSSSVDFELCRNVIDRYDKCCETWREREKRGET